MARPVLVRSATRRIVAGVGGGIAERLEVETWLVRLAFVALTLAGGVGVVLYLLAWIVSGDPRPGNARPLRRVTPQHTVAGVMVIAGVLLLLRSVGLWFGDAVVWPLSLAVLGAAILWRPGDPRFDRLSSRLPRSSDTASDPSKARLAAGAVLVVAGMVALLAANTRLGSIGIVTFAVAITALGLGVILGPWIYDLLVQLRLERRERIRSEEREEIAAHLHDSALQTLAMIQRTSDPQEMQSLARIQERELRQWLYGRTNGADTLRAAIEETAARVERMHRIAIETVVVGDADMDEALRALVDAAGEAMTNAAVHSGAASVSVYVEAEPRAVTIYVRDEGRGFDMLAVPEERRGIEGSIRARVERNGGAATIASVIDEGTEVKLVMPRKAP